MRRFLQFRLASHNQPVVAGCDIARADYACTVVVLLLLMNCTRFMNTQLFSHLGKTLCGSISSNTDTIEVTFCTTGPHASFKFVLDCLDYLKV